MNLELEQKSVVITGGSRGIGKAIAIAFAREGSHLSLCARNKIDLIETQLELQAFGGNVYVEPCDVGDREALSQFLENSHSYLGQIDVLVNNASSFARLDRETDWKAAINIDVMAAARATRKVAPWMKEKGGGCIINISSISGLGASSPPYGAAKAALISLSKSHAIALAKDGIRVNTVAPGSIFFKGGSWDRLRHKSPDIFDSKVGSIPWGRMGRPEEVADVVVFLASKRASWITGSCVIVDGGQHLTPS